LISELTDLDKDTLRRFPPSREPGTVNANFEATGMNGSGDVADVLLMLMTYDALKVSSRM
jgi:hypothetical protein